MAGIQSNTSSGDQGTIKDKVNTADTPARPGRNSAELPEHGHQSHLDRVAEDSARRGLERQSDDTNQEFTH